jgi:quercetin dioxygenase-like cupin family protein
VTGSQGHPVIVCNDEKREFTGEHDSYLFWLAPWLILRGMNVVPFTVPAGEGKSYSVVGDRYTILASAEHTAGSYDLFEFYVPPRHGPPPHVHTREDELFYVLEGELEFEVGGAIYPAPAGTFVFAPRGVPHRFVGVGDAPARVLVVAQPSGMARFFADIGRELPDRRTPPLEPTQEDIAKLLATAPKYGIEILA